MGIVVFWLNFDWDFSQMSSQNIPSLIKIVAWHLTVDRPLSEPTMAQMMTHRSVSRPRWVEQLLLNVIPHNIGNWNPLHATVFSGNKNIYLHFTSFLHIDMTKVFEILPRVRQELNYSTYNITDVDVLATQGDKASAAMIFSMLNRINSVTALYGLNQTNCTSGARANLIIRDHHSSIGIPIRKIRPSFDCLSSQLKFVHSWDCIRISYVVSI